MNYNYKIVETDNKYPDLLLYRDRSEDCDEHVIIHAIGSVSADETDHLKKEVVEFADSKSAKRFIRDFSVESANEWCAEEGISYSK